MFVNRTGEVNTTRTADADEGGPLELWLVRHGETTWNASRRYQGQSESDLSPLGREQATSARRRLHGIAFRGAFASDLRRAVQTAKIILAGEDVPLVASRLIRELHFGCFEGLTIEQIRDTYPEEYRAWAADLSAVAPPGGETLRQQCDRAGEFLAGLTRENGGGRYLVVAHGGSIRALLFEALGIDLRLYWRVAVANASLTVLEFAGGKWRLRLLNDVCHLASAERRYRGGVGAAYGLRLV